MKTDLQKIFKTQNDIAPWLGDFRQGAFKRFEAQGLPTSKQEDWKYTSVKALAEASFVLPEAKESSQALAVDSLFKEATYRLTFVGNTYCPELSQVEGLPQGLQLMPLSQAWQQESELLKDYLTKALNSEKRPFVALNEAFLSEGLFLQVPKGLVVDKPIEFCHLAWSHGQATMTHPRLLVLLEENAQATLIEHYQASGDKSPTWTNSVTEFYLKPGSHLQHVRLQEKPLEHFYLNSTAAQLAADANLSSFSFDLGASLNRQELIANLNAPGAHASLQGLYLAQAQQHTDFQTLIHHHQPHGTSQELFKGILTDKSHGVFNGQIVVDPHAQKTASELTNKNLLLSKEAQVDTKPLLKIFADDVRCSHGATIGRLDQGQLFYFQSRGIDSQLAKHLMTYAFAAELLADLPEALQKSLSQRIKLVLGLKDGNS